MMLARGRSLRRFLGSLLISGGRRGVLALGIVLLAAGFEGLGLALLVPIIGIVLGQGGNPAGQAMLGWVSSLVGGNRQTLLATALGVFLLVMILRSLVLFARDRVLWQVQSRFVAEQRTRLVNQLAAARWSDLVTLDHAGVTSQLSGEIGRVSTATTQSFQIIVALALLIVQCALALLLAPGFGALILLLLAGIALPALARLDRIGTLGQFSSSGNAELLGAINQLLNGLKVALAQGMGPQFSGAFDRLQRRQLGFQREFSLGRARDQLLFGVASAVAVTLLVGIGIGLFNLSPAILITMIVIFTRVAGPIRSLQQALPQLFFTLSAYEAIVEMRAALAAARVEPATPLPLAPGLLIFRDVCYLHRQGGGVKRGSFTIAAGEMIGICGASGSGKTSLLDLAAGLLVPQSGTIQIGNTSLDAHHLAAWQARIAYATQEPFLFFGSVRDNLLWGGAATEDALWVALDRVGAGDLVKGLSDGLDTLVGERGAALSGGERQRLILARAMLRKPALLILDEASSSLDAPSEAAIIGAFRALDPRPAILFVTHRAESLMLCDRVLTMTAGEITD